MSRTTLLGLGLAAAFVVCNPQVTFADTPDADITWKDINSKKKSLVFGRFIGKFETTDFRDRRVRMQHSETGKQHELRVDDGLGLIAELVPPGMYEVVSVEAIYYPQIGGPFKPGQYRPIRQKFVINPRADEAPKAEIFVPADRPVYIGTIQASTEADGLVYRGHHLRVIDDFEQAYDRLGNFYPTLAADFVRQDIVPVRHFMLKPTRSAAPLELVVGMDDPVSQAREYITEGKYKQATNWLATFMPSSDEERNITKLLVGEALLGDKQYEQAIETLGEVLLSEPDENRALRLLARAHSLHGNSEDAENLYRALSQNLPGDAEAMLQLGYTHALQADETGSHSAFTTAFDSDFDYLLNDFGPFITAVKSARDQEKDYTPARVLKFKVAPPRGIQSRRASQDGGMSILIDHVGKVIAVQYSPTSTGSAPRMMMAIVKATFKPASLNGVPVPCLLVMGSGGPTDSE